MHNRTLKEQEAKAILHKQPSLHVAEEEDSDDE
jgi:hypothetical protein